MPAPADHPANRRQCLGQLAHLAQLAGASMGLTIASLGLPGATARAAEAGFEWRAWPAKQPTPELALPRLDGTRWRLAEQKGQALLINFWATWCGPCRAEMPSLARLAQRHAEQGLRVVLVNYQESAATVQRYLQLMPLTLPVLLDADGLAAKAWTPRVFPSTVLVSPAGRPVGQWVGEVDWDSADATQPLQRLLASTARRPG